MQNFRAKRASLYNMKTTVKHNFAPIIEPNTELNVKQINISDKDKFGDIVYKGSKGGGAEKSRKTYNYTLKREKKVHNRYYSYSHFSMRFNKPQCIGKLILHFGTWYRIISQN